MDRAVIKTFPRKKYMPQGANNRNFSDSMTVGALKKFYGSTLLTGIKLKFPDSASSFEFLFADMDVGLSEIYSRLPENMPCSGRVIKPFSELTPSEQEACRQFIIEHLCIIRDEAKKICHDPMSTQSQVERAMFFFNDKFPRNIGPYLVFPSFDDCVYLIDSQPIILIHGFAEDTLMWVNGGMQKYFDDAEKNGTLSGTQAFDGTSAYAENVASKPDRIAVQNGDEKPLKPEPKPEANNFAEPENAGVSSETTPESESEHIDKTKLASIETHESRIHESHVIEESSFWSKNGLKILLAILFFILLLILAIWLLTHSSDDETADPVNINGGQEQSSALQTDASRDLNAKDDNQAASAAEQHSGRESVFASDGINRDDRVAGQMLPLDNDDDSFGKEEILSADAVKNLEEIAGAGADAIGTADVPDIQIDLPKTNPGEETSAFKVGDEAASDDAAIEKSDTAKDQSDSANASSDETLQKTSEEQLAGDPSSTPEDVSTIAGKSDAHSSDKASSDQGIRAGSADKSRSSANAAEVSQYDEFGDDASGFRQVDRSALIRIEPIDIKLAKTDGVLAVQAMSHGCDVSKLRSYKRNSAGVYLFLNAGSACPNVEFDEVRCEPKSGISTPENAYACYLISRKDRVKIKMNTVLKK